MSTNQARTVLGPLTTSIALPSSCFIPIEDCLTCGQAWGAQTCFASTATSTVKYGVQDNTDCWPPTTSFAVKPTLPFLGWGFYSPGLACPTGMTSACSATAGGQYGWPVQYGLLDGETAVGCCPPGYTCANGGAQTCLLTATKTSFQVGSCQSGSTGAFAYRTMPQVVTTTNSGTVGLATQSSYVLLAPLIQINWKASDRAAAVTSSSATPSSTSSGGASQTSSMVSTSSTAASSSGISSGAIAGIAVGVAAVAIALLAMAFFFIRKRRNAAYKSPPEEYQSAGKSAQLYDMNHSQTPAPPYTGSGGVELGAEVPKPQPAAELATPIAPKKDPGPVYEMS